MLQVFINQKWIQIRGVYKNEALVNNLIFFYYIFYHLLNQLKLRKIASWYSWGEGIMKSVKAPAGNHLAANKL